MRLISIHPKKCRTFISRPQANMLVDRDRKSVIHGQPILSGHLCSTRKHSTHIHDLCNTRHGIISDQLRIYRFRQLLHSLNDIGHIRVNLNSTRFHTLFFVKCQALTQLDLQLMVSRFIKFKTATNLNRNFIIGNRYSIARSIRTSTATTITTIINRKRLTFGMLCGRNRDFITTRIATTRLYRFNGNFGRKAVSTITTISPVSTLRALLALRALFTLRTLFTRVALIALIAFLTLNLGKR